MKKLIVTTLTALTMFTTSAMALTPMDAKSMKATSGQAGVSIGARDIIIETWADETVYTDLDGTDGTAASINLGDRHTITQMNGLVSFDGTDLSSAGLGLFRTSLGAFNTDTDADGIADTFLAAPLSIDVGTCVAASAAATYNESLQGNPAVTVTGVVIGLPTIEIHTSSDSYTISMSQAGAGNDGVDMFQVSKGANTMHILGGSVEIAAH